MKKCYLVFVFFLSCVVTGAKAQLPQLNLVLVQQAFNKPLDVKHCGDERLFIVEQGGKIRIMNKDGVVNATPFLDISSQVLSSGNEQGLLGLAFGPDYKNDGYFYVDYTTGSGSGSTRISRFSVSSTDSNVADPNSEVILLTQTQPYTNHNGGNLMFDKQGYLYINFGDGGSGNDPQNNAQNKNTFLGKILRIDVSGALSYSIPSDNPFVGEPNVKEEIWVYGVRNPWRSSFDRLTGDLWVADVGQNVYEEIDFQPSSSLGGENYGWRCREGFHAAVAGCPPSVFTDPVFEYAHSNFSSCSVTGGYVYRGAQYSKLFGLYLLTDFCSGRFWSVRNLGNGIFDPDTLQDFINNQYTSFGEDNNGELYVTYRGLNATDGRIYRITETSDCTPVAFITFEDSVSGCSQVMLNALKGDTLNYQWYNSSGQIASANSNQLKVQQSGWYKVQVSKQQAGCEAFSDSVYVSIFDTTALTTANTVPLFCIQDTMEVLSGLVQPEGGTFISLLVVADSILNPSLAGAGLWSIPYEFTNNLGCKSSINLSVEVGDSTTLVTDSLSITLCQGSGDISLDGFVIPTGGTYSGSGILNNQFSTSQIRTSQVEYSFTNSYGCVSKMNFTVTVDACLGVSDVQQEIDFKIFPNPASETITITLITESNSEVQLQIQDLNGKVMLEKFRQLYKGSYSDNIDLSYLSSGMYFVSLKAEGVTLVKKLIVE